MKRPLLWYAVAYVLGEVSEHCGLKTAVPLAVLLWMAAGVKKSGQRRRLWFPLPFFFLLGILCSARAGKAEILDSVFEEAGKAELFGEVEGEVERMERRESDRGEEWRIRLKACEVFVEGIRYSVKGILVTMDEAEVLEGNRITVSGRIKAMELPGNPGQFDSRAYYRSMGISYLMKGNLIKNQGGKGKLWKVALRRLREWMSENLEGKAGLFRAIVLGEKWAADKETADLYTEAGIGHLLAISGLHISLAGMGVYRFLKKKMKRSYPLSAAACIGAAFGYFVVTGEAASANRAYLMLGIYGIGQVFGRQYDLASAAALAGMLILLRSPLLLFQGGFQLSFGCILALGILAPELARLGKGKGKIREKIWALFVPGLSIQLVTFPIQAFSFYQFPVYGIFLNLLVLPLFPPVAVSGLLGAFFGGAFPKITEILLMPAEGILFCYEKLCRLSLSLPGAVLRTGRPEEWQLFLYLTLFSLLYRWVKREKKGGEKNRKKRRLVVFVGGISLSLFPFPAHNLEVCFLDVGQGDSCFIRIPNGKTFLVDGGSSDETGPGTYRIEPFLDSKAVEKIDYVMVSHGDEDHINGIRELMEHGRVKNLIFPKGQTEKQEALAQMKKEAVSLKIGTGEIGQGEWLRSGEVRFYCLWPAQSGTEENASGDKNEASMVLWLTYGAFDVLFTGDLEGAGEAAVGKETERMKQSENRDLEILKVGHHGSKNSSSDLFLQETMPLFSVISCGKDNRYGHPAKETLERLEKIGSGVFRTDRGGAVTVKTDGKKMIWSRGVPSDMDRNRK